MSDFVERPEVQVFAGPDGSGKSTITKMFPIAGEYVNADDIQMTEKVSPIEAAEKAMKLKRFFIENRMNFTFETVMSSHYNLDILNEAKRQKFIITVVYIITCDPEINVDRVHLRVQNGGHDVPEEKIRSGYYKSLANIRQVYLLADNFVLYDNSHIVPCLLVDKKTDRAMHIHPSQDWPINDIIDLVLGDGNA